MSTPRPDPFLDLDADGYGLAVLMPGDDSIVWRAVSPAPQDRWVSVEWAGDSIAADSWNGIRVRFDPASGRVESSSFTKWI
jgi:hypothetical protein